MRKTKNPENLWDAIENLQCTLQECTDSIDDFEEDTPRPLRAPDYKYLLTQLKEKLRYAQQLTKEISQ